MSTPPLRVLLAQGGDVAEAPALVGSMLLGATDLHPTSRRRAQDSTSRRGPARYPDGCVPGHVHLSAWQQFGQAAFAPTEAGHPGDRTGSIRIHIASDVQTARIRLVQQME
jgi:hypothetical protein